MDKQCMEKDTGENNFVFLHLDIDQKFDKIFRKTSVPDLSFNKVACLSLKAKIKNIDELKEGWKDKLLYGKYPIRASDSDVNSSLTHH